MKTDTTYNPADLILVRSDNGDGGWSLHPPMSTDDAIANGLAPILAEGEANRIDNEWDRPNDDDYELAMSKLRPATENKINAYTVSDGVVTEDLNAETLDEAIDEAREWALGGSYEETTRVPFWINDEDGDTVYSGSVIVEVDNEPECEDGQEHDWQSPHELVGGLEENPGVQGLGGAKLMFSYVCSNCGCRKTVITDPSDDLDDVTYEDADEATLAWVAKNQEEEVDA